MDLDLTNDQMKAVLSLLAGLPKPRNKKSAMPTNNIIGWLADELIQWIHVSFPSQENKHKNV
jgi:hypothetical protein